MPRSAVSLVRLLPASDPAPADALVLRAFETTRSEAAFTELVRRYGPMVLATCRRVLGHPEDAEDAFQAVFLVLTRKASTVRGNLSGWLYAVAVRTARSMRIMRERRRNHEIRAAARSESAVLTETDHDLAAVIDEELARLPEHYRVPIVLCELRGLSRKQAANELGVPEGTLSGRLAVAKRKLAALLSARGLAPAAPLALLAPTSVSAGLVESAVWAVRGTAGPVASAAASAVVKAMLIDQLKVVALAAGMLLTMVCGAFAMTGGDRGEQPVPAPALAPRLLNASAAKLDEQHGASEFAERATAANPLAAHAKVKAFPDETPKIEPKPAGQLHRFDGHTNLVGGVAFFPTGDRIVTSGFDATYRIWDPKTGKELDNRSTGPKESLVGGPVAIAPDGKRIAARYFVAEAVTGKFLFGLEGHTGRIARITYSTDGKRILTASHDGTVRVWDSEGKELQRIDAHMGQKIAITSSGRQPREDRYLNRGASDAAFSSDGKRIVSGGVDGAARVWDMDTAKELQCMKLDRVTVMAVAFLPDDKRVVSSGNDGIIHIWDAADGKELGKCEGHTGIVAALAVARDGRRVVSAGHDKTVRVWDAETGKELRCFRGHTAAVQAVAVSPDGKTALSGGEDNTARLWAMPTVER
jgi:RNA polymerase sigma factor (sigma-70 family)